MAGERPGVQPRLDPDAAAHAAAAIGRPLWHDRRLHAGVLILAVLLLLYACELRPGTPGGDTALAGRRVAAPSVERYNHAAVRLRDGRVLVTGGQAADAAATAEIYDPAAERWHPAAPMATPRWGHSATLLADGRVLVVGGHAGSSSIPTAELYDPVGDAWRAAATPAHPYRFHTATLLADGRVLVAGGAGTSGATSGVNGAQAAAETYDPTADRWADADFLRPARRRHAAVRLPDGRVLVVGGRTGESSAPLAATQLYDPATNRWQAGPPAPAESGQATATLVGGRVLVGGVARLAAFDPATGTWTKLGQGRGDILAGPTPSGLILFVGLDSDQASALGLYDPATGAYHAIGRLPAGNDFGSYTATLLDDGRVLLVGLRERDGGAAIVVDTRR
jgi:hypothetical protein